jgi:hypothetical protein
MARRIFLSFHPQVVAVTYFFLVLLLHLINAGFTATATADTEPRLLTHNRVFDN